MATSDAEFIKKLRATFNVEAQEHLQAISHTLLELQKSPEGKDMPLIENIYREAHSLKGASRAVDLKDVEKICQAMEGVFATWKREPPDLSTQTLDTLNRALDSIHDLIASTQVGTERPGCDELIGRLSRLQSASPAASRVNPAAIAQPAEPAEPAPARAAATEGDKTVLTETVRIPINKLDARLSLAEEMLTFKAKAAQQCADLREITGSFDRWWKEWGKVSSDMRALRREIEHRQQPDGDGTPICGSAALVHFLDWNSDCLRSLENKLAALSAQAEQDRHGLGKRVDDLLEDSKKLLMLPFSTVGDLFSKVVRDLCRDQGKEANLTIEGGEVGIDKRILEEMKDALIHVLRNCVDHGIERPEERRRADKPARATITLSVARVNGDKVEIRITDDGAGIDVGRVRKSAVGHGWVSEAEARAMDDGQALSLVFHSGVSTSPIITEISGRGLGMAIVRAKAEKLGGRVAIESRPHAGTTLRITLPLTLATFRGILISSAGQVFVAPTVSVERVMRVRRSAIQSVENRETISLNGRVVSLARLEAVLGLSGKAKRADDAEFIAIVVLRWADQRIALAVDEVLREEEVLIKPLRKPLTRVRNIAGATVLGSGKAIAVLNVADLVKTACVRADVPNCPAGAAESPTASKRILVVEDSITSRTLLKGILETAGYQVKTAVDGVDAFTILREEQFDLVVSDVEMPRMNGLELTSRIRADHRLAQLPVALVTALESRQERERGIDVGANAYINKSSFDQSNLLEVVRRFV